MSTAIECSSAAAELRRARLAAGLTQQQAAELMGYSTSGWRKWEAGTRRIPSKLLHFFQIAVEKT